MIFLSSVAATLVFFDHSGDIIHINISTSVGVEPTNTACAPSTATSDVLNHYTIEASPKKDAQVAYIRTLDAAVHAVFVGSTPTEVEILIWIMSPLWSKKTSVAAKDERNIIILHRKIVNIEPIYGVYCSV